jgi:hypothetical protein
MVNWRNSFTTSELKLYSSKLLEFLLEKM